MERFKPIRYRRRIHTRKGRWRPAKTVLLRFGWRLRAVGVPLETRKVLLHHTKGNITIHYSPVDIQELLDAVAKLSEMRPMTLLKKVVG